MISRSSSQFDGDIVMIITGKQVYNTMLSIFVFLAQSHICDHFCINVVVLNVGCPKPYQDYLVQAT